MRTKVMYACVVVLLLVAPTTFAEVVESGSYGWDGAGGGSVDGWWTYTVAWSNSSGAQPGGWAGGEGYYDLITTRGGVCSCSLSVSASASADVHLYSGGYCAAQADAYAEAYLKIRSRRIPAGARVSGSGTGGEHLGDDDPLMSDYITETDWWSEGYGPSAHHYAVVATSVPSGGADTASAAASANASVSMSEI